MKSGILFSTVVLNLGIIDILGWVTLCWEHVQCRMSGSIPGLYPLDDSITTPTLQV